MESKVPDESLHRVVHIHHVDADVVGECAVGKLGVRIEMAVGIVQPTGICRGVVPFHVGEVFYSDVVSSLEESERQPVAC